MAVGPRKRALAGLGLAACLAFGLCLLLAPQTKTRFRRYPQGGVEEPGVPPSMAAKMEARRLHMEAVCDKEKEASLRTVWRVASNRLNDGRHRECDAQLCPIIVDQEALLYVCFVHKAGSTVLKKILLDVANVSVDTSAADNETAFHLEANEKLQRISPMFFPQSITRRFLRVVVVRHPFARLASAYRDKVLRDPETVAYFYAKYWNKLLYKERGKVNPGDKPTFKEFTKFLLDHDPAYYDVHWAPIWSRCEPCLAHYDVIVKLENARAEMEHVSRILNVSLSGLKDHPYKTSDRELFLHLSPKEIDELYDTFRLDFLLFNYTLEEFLSPNVT